MADEIVTIGLGLDTSGIEKGNAALDTLASKGDKVEASLGKVEKAAGSAGKSIGNLGGASSGGIAAASAASERAAGSMDKLGQASQQAGRGMSEASDSARGLGAQVSSLDGFIKGAIGAISVGAVIQLGRAFLSVSDEVTTLRTRLALSSQSAAEAGAAYSGLLSIAQRARVSFTELGGTYAQIARSTQELGLSQDRLLRVTETIAKSMTISGGSAGAMQAALVQLSQGFASGTLRGEELNSILEQTPRLAQAIADGLGVPIGKLREMGAAGQLTGEQIVVALEKASASIDAEFSRTAATVGQASTVLANATLDLVGAFDKLSGVSGGAASGLILIADAIGAISRGLDKVSGNPGLEAIFRLATLGPVGFAVDNARRTVSNAVRLLDSPGERAARDAGKYTTDGSLELASLAAAESAAKAASKYRAAVDDFASAKGNLTKAQQKTAGQLELLTRYSKVTQGLGQESAEFQRAYAALQTGLSNIEAQYAAKKTAGTKAVSDRADSLKREAEAQEALNAVIAQALQRDDERSAKDASDARKAIEQDLEKRIEAQKKLNETVAEEVKSMRASAEERGLSVDAVERLRTARLNEADAQKIQEAQRQLARASTEEERAGIRETIASLQDLIQLRTQGTENKIADRATEGFERAYSEIERGLTDSLFRAAEAGKGFFESLRDSIKGMFNNLVLKPIVSAVMRPVAAALTSWLPGSAIAGPSGGGTASSLSSAASLAGSLGSFGSFGSSFGTSMATAFSGPGLAATLGEAGALLSSGGTAAGLGMGLGAIAPYAMAAYALYSLLSQGGEKRAGSTYGYSANDIQYGQGLNGIWSDNVAGMIGAGQTRFIGGPSGGEIGGDTMRQAVAATVEGINGLFDRLGSTDKIDQFWGKLEQSTKGRGGVFSGGTLASGATFGESSWESGTSRTLTTEEAISAFALDLQQSVVQALQAAADIPASITDLLRDVDAEALTQEQVGALLQAIESIVMLTDAAAVLGVSADAVTTAMIQAAGGIEGLGSGIAAYYENFYTEAERAARSTELLSAQFAGLGLAMPDTRESFRALVESLDLTTTEGQTAYGSLMSLSGAFAALVPPTEAAADAVVDAVAEVMTLAGALDALRNPIRSIEQIAQSIVGLELEGKSLEVQRLSALGMDGEAAALQRQLDTAGMTPDEISLYDYNAGLRAEIDGITAARTAEASAAAAARAAQERIAQQRYSLETTILQLEGNTAALRERELALLDDSLRPLQERIYHLEDEKSAAQNAAEASREYLATLSETTEKYGALAKSLRDYARELQFGPAAMLSPEDAYRAARDEFDEVSAKALTDPESAAQLREAGNALLSASQAVNASGAGYFRDLDRILSVVNSAEVDASARVDVASLQLTAMRSIETTGQQTVDRLSALVSVQSQGTAQLIELLQSMLSQLQSEARGASLGAQADEAFA